MRFGGIVLAAALLLGACTDDPAPKEPTGTTSATAGRPTPTATLPVMPDQAKENSPEGATALVAYWVELSNYAAETGDVEALARISASDCEGCAKYIELYRTTYSNGGYFKGGAWELGDARVSHVDESYFVAVHVSWDKSSFKADAHDEEHADGAGSDDLTFEVRGGKVRQLVLGGAE